MKANWNKILYFEVVTLICQLTKEMYNSTVKLNVESSNYAGPLDNNKYLNISDKQISEGFILPNH